MKRLQLCMWGIIFLIVPELSVAQNYTERAILNLSDIFTIDDSLLTNNTDNAYFYKKPTRKTISNYPYKHDNVLHINSALSSNSNVLIIANDLEYSKLSSIIKRYADDIHTSLGYGIDIEVVSNANYVNIKQCILSYTNNLVGAVLVGTIDVAYFELPNDHSQYGYRNWPCDLYYMDLDGVWDDNDDNGIFDSHTGNVEPEIFIGRISAENVGAQSDKIEILKDFFNRDHLYWVSQSSLKTHKSLSYINNDWENSNDIVFGIDKLYETENTIHYTPNQYSNFGKNDYCNNIASTTYTMVQLAAHSSPQLHLFTNNLGNREYLYSNTINNIDKKPIGYNLFCCSACNWKATSSSGYIGGAYLYGNKSSALFVVGSTKTGSMLGFSDFYTPLNEGDCIGEAIVEWWKKYPNKFSTTSKISWFYGLSILGDPLIKPYREKYCPNTIHLEVFDSTNHSTNIYYRASKKIIIDKNYVTSKGVKVTFDSPSISIENNFECSKGTMLETRTNGCE